MRILLALGLVLALVPAACAGNAETPAVATAQDGTKAASAGPSATPSRDPDAPLKFSRCMREHGITWFPDPDNSGRMTIKVPQSQDPKKFDAARQACEKLMPDGGENHQPNPEDIERARQMAKCMRENGVPDFPDPQPNGSIRLDRDKISSKPGDPTFDKAEKACSKYLPQGRTERRKTA
nr:hypothetical protein [uncultured Actinoplanes sp.]